MGRRERARRERKRNMGSAEVVTWLESDGLHALVPADASPTTLEEMTKRYQESIRRSPLWDLMVKEYGEEEATRLLQQFRVERK